MTLAQDPLSLPRDAKLICLLLESLGVSEYDPLVVHQLLELGHRHMSDLLQDAQMYSEHADRKDTITVEDIRLAVENKVATSFVNPPSKDVCSFELGGLIRWTHDGMIQTVHAGIS
jgi:transcription initiation factor TFIID subunit 9B